MSRLRPVGVFQRSRDKPKSTRGQETTKTMRRTIVAATPGRCGLGSGQLQYQWLSHQPQYSRHLFEPPLAGSHGCQGNAFVERNQACARRGREQGRPVDGELHLAGRLDPAAGRSNTGQTTANARKVATDSKAVYYIGEFNSGASEVSVPILNQAGMPQVSPGNTYVGLTDWPLPGSAPGEPQKYYPTGTRTYLRIVPIDSIQAAADLMAMKEAGCTRSPSPTTRTLRRRSRGFARDREGRLRSHDHE